MHQYHFWQKSLSSCYKGKKNYKKIIPFLKFFVIILLYSNTLYNSLKASFSNKKYLITIQTRTTQIIKSIHLKKWYEDSIFHFDVV